MGRGKTGLIRFWGSVLFTLVYLTPQAMSYKDERKTCNPSHCGNITNISHPFRLREDPTNCGLRNFELSCKNNVAKLDLYSGTYQVLGIDYDNYRIRLRDPDIREGGCSSLPRYSLSLSNFSDSTDDDSNNPYTIYSGSGSNPEVTFEHVFYLNCSDPVRGDSGYADTAPCVHWGSKGGGGGHVYAVAAADLVSDMLKPGCRVKSVATIASDWRSSLQGRNYSYADIHRVLSQGFEISWWPQACSDHLSCASNQACFFNNHKRKFYCQDLRAFCFGFKRFSLFCGKAAELSYRTQAFLVGILAGLPFSRDIHNWVVGVYSMIESDSGHKYVGDLISTRVAFTLGKITSYVSIAMILRYLVGITLLFILLIYTYRRRHLSMYESIEDFIKLHNLHPIRYSYKDLKTMTRDFKTKLGGGGFGTVYKGKLRSGSDVAVKMLGNNNKSKASTSTTCQDFINEVATIGRIHHFNVVRLVGFCVEGTKRALIYEFMSNGSLDRHIFCKEGRACLSYRKIYEISLGVARGIAYLHHGCDMQILHFDIKPPNILLDDNLTPKIADFGLAKLYFADESIATLTATGGTVGYMAPELFYKNIGKVSHKSDVYSFGMLLMEMASRRKNLNPKAEHSSQVYFPSWIYDQFEEDKDFEMEDLTKEEKDLVKKMFIIALWCIQFNPADRPSMNKVIEMLEADGVENLEMPPKPSIYPENDRRLDSDQTTSSFSISSLQTK